MTPRTVVLQTDSRVLGTASWQSLLFPPAHPLSLRVPDTRLTHRCYHEALLGSFPFFHLAAARHAPVSTTPLVPTGVPYLMGQDMGTPYGLGG